MAREMKNSGVKWIGEIPSNWGISKLKYHVLISSGDAFLPEYEADDNMFPLYGGGEQMGYSNKSNTKKGCLIVGRVGSCGNVNCPEKDFWATDNALIVKPSLPLRFSYYLLLAANLKSLSTSNAQPLITSTKIKNVSIPLPPLSEQKVIADFLDAKCGEIDGLLADLDAEVNTLTEYKKSIIAETVTRGLNPNAPMKSSGIPWAESIPAHWTIQKGKYTFKLLQRPVKEDDGVITCFRDGEVTLRSNRREDGFTMSEKEYGYQGIEPGDLVVHGMDGFAGSIGISDSRGKATPVLNVLDSNHNKRYLMYYLRNMAYGNVFLALSTGIRVRSCDLSWKKLGEIRIVLPTIDEQIKIANYLDSKCAAIDQAITDKTQQIETLKAYKSSLIYEYVTGKKQVL